MTDEQRDMGYDILDLGDSYYLGFTKNDKRNGIFYFQQLLKNFKGTE